MDHHTVSSIMEVIQELVPKDTSIAIANDKQYIYYQPSKQIDLKIKPGDQIREGTATFKALKVKQKISDYIDKNILGISYFGMSVPIVEGNQLKGCVTAILPRKPITFPTSFLTVKSNDRWLPLPFNQIMFLEAQSRKTNVHSSSLVGTHKFNLTELEFFLPSDLFIRCHRSYIININFIAEIHPDSHSTFLLIMKDGAKIPVSQTYASQFRKILCF
ncbi:LytTR family transcriptional regulator DNA-binding domain-containing protein [Heyndrickxia sporothermodurans]|uniref:LytTR family DNA-binding domain-containing protein n=1 Tax=Heyndrickxia sporothermodurans TaxID=46224 RepID=UPI002DBF8DF7|nr:LytTR family DNA-binding domain-containing protein [Heyndrickxia sporothermodurans]MEB6550828.1 LytTR family transcriptional regulator DNA-binding domain-containing protein [Heyndrickxia sporothermodurans]